MAFASIGEHEHHGYVPGDLGIGGGDDMEFDLCLDCGQLQGTWPMPVAWLESVPECPSKCGFKGIPEQADYRHGYKHKCPQCGERFDKETWQIY